jgi:hypothetical protein
MTWNLRDVILAAAFLFAYPLSLALTAWTAGS